MRHRPITRAYAKLIAIENNKEKIDDKKSQLLSIAEKLTKSSISREQKAKLSVSDAHQNELSKELTDHYNKVGVFEELKLNENLPTDPLSQSLKEFVIKTRNEMFESLTKRLKKFSPRDEKQISNEIKNFSETIKQKTRQNLINTIGKITAPGNAGLNCPILQDFPDQPIFVYCKDIKTSDEAKSPHIFDLKSFRSLPRRLDPDTKSEFVFCPLDRRKLSADNCYVQIPEFIKISDDYKKYSASLVADAEKINSLSDTLPIFAKIHNQQKLIEDIQGKISAINAVGEQRKNELLSELLAQSMRISLVTESKSDIKMESTIHIVAFKKMLKECQKEEFDRIKDQISAVKRVNEEQLLRQIRNFYENIIERIKIKLSDYIKNLNLAERADFCCPISLDLPTNPVIVHCRDEKSLADGDFLHLFDAKSLQDLPKTIDDKKNEFIYCPLDRTKLDAKKCKSELNIVTSIIDTFRRSYNGLLKEVRDIITLDHAFAVCRGLENFEKSIETMRDIVKFAILDHAQKLKITRLVDKLKINPYNQEHKNFWVRTNGSLPNVIWEMMKIDTHNIKNFSEYEKILDNTRKKAKIAYYDSWMRFFTSLNKNTEQIFNVKDINSVVLKS